jgi:rhodanese-related sulfurtransferase
VSLAQKLTKLFEKPYDAAPPEQARALVDDGALLVDVREPREWTAGHAPTARHIPLSQLPSRMQELPRGRRLVTVCRSGARSRRAAALLTRDGRQVTNLSGGMAAWAAAGLPVVATGGRPGTVV